MAIVQLNKKNINELKIKDVNGRLSMMGCPVDSEDKNKIIVEISPNRPDFLSEQGIIRALKTFCGKEKGLKKYIAEKSDYVVNVDSSLKDIRPFTACAVVKNLKFNNEKIQEIIDIQEKLHTTYGRNRKKIAIGIYPFEKIEMPITFKALPPNEIKFQPLETDREMTGIQILSQHKAGREFAHLLEGKKKFSVFIDNKKNIMSMPPIINSHKTGKITEKTTEIFIECSGFDFNALSKCLNIIVCALSDMGGKIYSVKLNGLNKTTPELQSGKIKININNVNKILGLQLKEADIKKLLDKMGFSYNNKTVEIPVYRTDILHEIDIIEDIAIAYGYENFKHEIPQISTIGQEDRLEIIKRKVSELMIGLNLIETCSYNLTNNEDENKKMNTNIELIKVQNAKTNYNVLRASVLPSLIRILSENKDKEYPQQIFEIGRTFQKNLVEEEKLAIAIIHEKSNFTEIKKILEYLSRNFDLNLKIETTKHPSFIEGRCGEILLDKKKVGVIGEINPQVLENFNLSLPAIALELNLSGVFEK